MVEELEELLQEMEETVYTMENDYEGRVPFLRDLKSFCKKLEKIIS